MLQGKSKELQWGIRAGMLHKTDMESEGTKNVKSACGNSETKIMRAGLALVKRLVCFSEGVFETLVCAWRPKKDDSIWRGCAKVRGWCGIQRNDEVWDCTWKKDKIEFGWVGIAFSKKLALVLSKLSGTWQ